MVSMVREWVKESREWFWGQGVGSEKGQSVERGRWARVSMRDNVEVRDRDREREWVLAREKGGEKYKIVSV